MATNRSGSLSSNQLIGSYQHIPSYPRPQHALHLLQKVASLVKPLMLSHGFHVGVLSEFYPQQQNLLGLNINHGAEIRLRLRQPYDTATFLSEDSIVGTMLHELTHNLHGPHDEKFYAFLDKLTDEYEKLRRSGYSGEGFYSVGKRLGEGRARNPGLAEARRRALERAERRRTLTVGSGQALGGGAPRGGFQDSREVMRLKAAAAADRRARDSMSCGQGQPVERQDGERTQGEVVGKDEEAWLREALDRIREMERAEEEMVKQFEREDAGLAAPAAAIPTPPQKRPASTPAPDGADDGRWNCLVCTLVNPARFLACDACGSTKPASAGPSLPLPPSRSAPRRRSASPPTSRSRLLSAYNTKTSKPKMLNISEASRRILEQPEKKDSKMWMCHQCTLVNENQWWTCQGCGVMKTVS